MNLTTWEFTGGPFHFGRRGLGQEVTSTGFASDSLFAALVSRLAELEGSTAIEKFIEPFRKNTPLVLFSSMFPRVGNIRFFPVPAARGFGETEEGISYKDMKKIRYISEKLFLRVIGGEDLRSIYSEAVKIQGGILLAAADEAKQIPPLIWKEEKRSRVTLDRNTQKSTLFFTGEIHFAKDCGLWTAAKILDEAIKPKIEALLFELGESGLGADRNAGLGRCTVSQGSDLVLPQPVENGFMVTLGRFLPKSNETHALTKPGAAYKLETIGGWVTSPQEMNQRRRVARMLTEGSVIGTLPDTAGDLVDVRPVYEGKPGLDHPVWRNGQVLAAAFVPPARGKAL